MIWKYRASSPAPESDAISPRANFGANPCNPMLGKPTDATVPPNFTARLGEMGSDANPGSQLPGFRSLNFVGRRCCCATQIGRSVGFCFQGGRNTALKTLSWSNKNGRISVKSARRFCVVTFRRSLRLPKDIILLRARRRRVGVVIVTRTGRTFSRLSHKWPARYWRVDIVRR